MVFCEIISTIEAAFLPVDVKLSLSDAIADPIEAHVDGLGSFLFDGVIGDAAGSAIVSLEWCGWLWVSQFFECDTHGAGFLAVVE